MEARLSGAHPTTGSRPAASDASLTPEAWRAFPPRLAHQPIYHPVANEAYAVQIARDWNTKDAASGYADYVPRFRVRSDYLARHPVQTAGARTHQEYWIPAEEMDELNAAIVGPIEVTAEFHAEGAA